MVQEIISGGQTGVDQAALDVAIEFNIPYSGYCPKGRLDETGHIPERFKCLKEITGEFKNEQENYNARTKMNIEDSDATLIIVPEIPLPEKIKDGTLLTISHAEKTGKPYLIVSLKDELDSASKKITTWLNALKICRINIAGPRESSCPGINEASIQFLRAVIYS